MMSILLEKRISLLNVSFLSGWVFIRVMAYKLATEAIIIDKKWSQR